MIINATKDPNVQPVSRGGTGKTTHTSNSVLTGNGTSNIGNVASANGALYATSANGAPKFGTLPVAQGGTGATTVAGARNNLGLGNTSGAVPVANGGTGATTASDARSNLGIKDYIIEQGTTNGWDYIKYASGKFTAWKYDTGAYSCTNASGNNYYSGMVTWNLPFTIVSGVANISLGQQCFASNVNVTTTQVAFRAMRGASATLTKVETHVVVHGTY